MSLKLPYKPVNRIICSLILTLIIGLLTTQQAAAHASLIRSDPAHNSILDSAPTTLNLWFSENISAAFSGVQLLKSDGQAANLEITIDSNDYTHMIVGLPELNDGVYSFRWSAHSEADGHLTQGLIVLGVGQGADLGTATAVETETAVAWQESILRWLTFTLYAGIVGAFATTYIVLGSKSQETAVADVQRAAQKRMLYLAWWCALLALLVGLAWAGWQAFSLAGSNSILAAAWQWLTQTRLGVYWWARQTILVIALNNFRILSRSQTEAHPTWVLPFTTILLLALLIIQSLTSHAAALTPNTALAITADILHLLAASFWVGGLLALVIGLVPLVWHSADFAKLVQAGWGPFGKWAALSVGLVLTTGLYSTGREISSANAMLTSLYGKTLLFKIIIVLLVGSLGAINSMLLHPRLAAPLGRLLGKPTGWTPLSLRQLPRLVVIEAGLGLAVLLLAGILTAAPTAHGPTFAATADVPLNHSQTVDDLLITLDVNPNRVGQNIFTVRAASSRRPPPADVLRIILRFTYLDQELGMNSADMNEIEQDLYILSGNQLNLAGRWRIDVVVRREGLEDSVAQFEWAVAPSGKQQPAIISDKPWESLLSYMATILLVLVVGVWGMAVYWQISQQ